MFGRPPIAGDLGKLSYDQAFDIGPGRFTVGPVRPIIADFRIRQNYDLAAIGGIGEDLLVARNTRVEDDLAVAFRFCTDALFRETVGRLPKPGPPGSSLQHPKTRRRPVGEYGFSNDRTAFHGSPGAAVIRGVSTVPEDVVVAGIHTNRRIATSVTILPRHVRLGDMITVDDQFGLVRFRQRRPAGRRLA